MVAAAPLAPLGCVGAVADSTAVCLVWVRRLKWQLADLAERAMWRYFLLREVVGQVKLYAACCCLMAAKSPHLLPAAVTAVTADDICPGVKV
jgi:hypothetical protein